MKLDPASYNAGLRAALDLTRLSQIAWQKADLHSTRKGFAVVALDQLACEIVNLLIPPDASAPTMAPVAPRPLAPVEGEGALCP